MKMGENGCEEEEWMLSNLVEKVREDEEEEEEEALSLCDLPNKEENQSKKESPGAFGGESQEDVDDFDFSWWGGSSSFKESEMCAADEVFFQGQILPLRHSISSDGGSLAGSFKNNGAPRCHSFRYTSGSSRSSSVRSLRSSSSGSSSTSTTTTTIHSKYYSDKKQASIIRNQSAPQQVRFSKVVSHSNTNNNCSSSSRKSITLWSLFRVGLVSTPEIDFQDLKIRQHNTNNNYKPFGSRNSSSSNNTNARVSVKRNLKQRFSDKNTMILFGSACSCSVNDVRTVPPTTATVGRNSSAKEAPHEDKNSETTKMMRKRTMSRRLRTFEWLKQLSLEAPAATTTTL